MDEHIIREDIFHILRLISSKPELTQRDLSGNLGISLGKTNYLLKELAKKGLLKAKDFTRRGGKIKKVKYALTKKGLEEKIRLDTLQAAILRVKLRYIDKWIEEKTKKAAFYNKLFSQLSNAAIIGFDQKEIRHSFNYYTVRIRKNRDAVQRQLKERGIASAIYYPLCLHLQEVYKNLRYKKE